MNEKEWISVKEKMPPIQESVLVYCSENVTLAWLAEDVYSIEPYWEDAYADHLQGITHWMPLPSPPNPQP